MGLILTVVLLFAFQAQTIIANPLIILLIAIPLLAQTYGIFALAHVLAKWLKLPHEISAPACLIGTSNFFELAVAVAISLFGLHSGGGIGNGGRCAGGSACDVVAGVVDKPKIAGE